MAQLQAELAGFRAVALGAYYALTLPVRAWCNARDAAAGQAPLVVLFYHRVADERPNPWTCSTALFARQIAWLQRHVELISLAEVQRRMTAGRNDRLAACVTFDDGYADNNSFALPLLVRQKIPCTYFVCTQHVLQGRPFPHDVARGAPLAPNTLVDLRRWAEAGVEIGAHTRTHADLGRLQGAALHDEFVAATHDLAAAAGVPVRRFAFPYGQRENLNPGVGRLADEAGLDCVCSAYGGYNWPGEDAFHVQRVHVSEALLRLKNWVTIDPRHRRLPKSPLFRSAPAPAAEVVCT